MSTTKSLLVELFAEELPPKALKKLGESFAQSLAANLKARGLTGEHSVVTPYATPRRLAAHISAVKAVAADAEVTEKLMPASIALSNGMPTEALLKRLGKMGRQHLADAWPQSVEGSDRLYVQGEGKAESVFLKTLAKGVALQVGLQSALDETLAALPIPKVMNYQLDDGWTSVNFVRPVHGLVVLHGAEVLPISVLGLMAGRTTHGHRFEALMEPVTLQDADHYAQQLERQGAVTAAFDHRHAEILRQLQHAAARQGLTPIDDAALLDEVTALVEWPNVLLCRFDPAFLAVPPECLILTMKANQKYFPLLDAEGRLTEKFLVVSNIRPADPRAVVQGNERVVRPRLADAKFFFDQDRKKTLQSRLPQLDKVVYHGKLGSQGERTERVRAIATLIGEQLGGPALAALADRAAQLAKADLVTEMVGEFPELQGVMGGYYARHDGEPEAIALAIEDHYKPRFAGDALPRNEVGVAVALADKVETLVGLFGVGERPTGDKDPFALRRHALGVIRMLIERGLTLELDALLTLAPPPFAGRIEDTRATLAEFVYERLAGSLREQGYSAHEVDAVLTLRPGRLSEVPKRLAAVRAFAALPEAAALAAANKRIANILKKSDAQPAVTIEKRRLVEVAELALHASLDSVRARADALFASGDYTASLRELAALRQPVDAFFDGVMVNADDAALRANRLALLAALHAAMNRIADLSKLAS
jgi:glycyl-tRNA synthetase beta chain